MFLGTVLYAIVNSVILALMAIGFNLTFGISGVANFAYGALYIFSAYTSWMLLNLLGLPYFLSAAIIPQINYLTTNTNHHLHFL